MTIYERPTKSLMADWARENIKAGQTFTKDDAVRWFARHYPRIKSSTVSMHVEVMSINSNLRKHYPSIKHGSGHDLFYKLGSDQFRLCKRTDPRPRYKQDFDALQVDNGKSSATYGEKEEPVDVTTGRKIAAKIFKFARRFRSTRSEYDIDLANTIVLVSCVKSKLPHPAPARSLYTSTWFRKTRDIVERSGTRWFVLSSLYGLVSPDAKIAPYDYTLNDLGVAQRRDWADRVLAKLLPAIVDERRVVMFAGHRYREFLVEPLLRRGIKVEVPMEHLTRGEQLAWLSEGE